jgi:hypothetical protein
MLTVCWHGSKPPRRACFESLNSMHAWIEHHIFGSARAHALFGRIRRGKQHLDDAMIAGTIATIGRSNDAVGVLESRCAMGATTSPDGSVASADNAFGVRQAKVHSLVAVSLGGIAPHRPTRKTAGREERLPWAASVESPALLKSSDTVSRISGSSSTMRTAEFGMLSSTISADNWRTRICECA